MPKFTPKRQEQILPQSIARVVSRTNLSDVSDVSAMKHILAASARADDELYYQMTLLLKLFSIDKAVGEDLDERAKEIQPSVVRRRQSVKAQGNVVFTRNGTTGTVGIPIGTKVKTADGSVFTTTTFGAISPTSAEQIAGHGIGRDSNFVSVTADVPGTAGNVIAATIIKFESKPSGGISEVTNLAATTQGRDKETDAAFRNRLRAFVSSLARCTVSALEANVTGQSDLATGQTIIVAKAIEDIVNRGDVIVYVEDGTGAAEATASTAQALAVTYTWNGTTTITTPDTTEVAAGDFIQLDSDGQFYEIVSVVPNTSVTISNPGAYVIPTGATQSSIATDLITEGLAGPPPDSAVGGEIRLSLDLFPIKEADPFQVTSSTRGLLTQGVDYVLNPAMGQLNFTPALAAGEKVIASYTYYTGLIALAQKIIDGDPNDRETYPGLRAAGILVRVRTPQVLLQNVIVSPTIKEGYTVDDVKAAIRQAIKDYINTLNIGDDVILNKLVTQMMLVPGVANVVVTTPAADITMLDDQLARTQDPNIVIV